MDDLITSEQYERTLRDETAFYNVFLNFADAPLEADSSMDIFIKVWLDQLKRIIEEPVETRSYTPLADFLNIVARHSSVAMPDGIPEYKPTNAKIDGTNTPPYTRRRVGRYFMDVSNLRPIDSHVRQRIDVALLPDNSNSAFSYADFLVPFHLTAPINEEESDRQLSDQALAIFNSQYDRNFVYCVSIRFPMFRVRRYDRSGGVSSEEFDLNDSFTRFVCLIRRFLAMSPSELGFDLTFEDFGDHLGPNKHHSFQMTLHDETRGNVRIKSIKQLWSAKTLTGKSTLCWLVKKLAEDGTIMEGEFLLKQTWSDPERSLTEADIYKLIDTEIKSGVARCDASEQGAKVSNLRKRLEAYNTDNPGSGKICRFEDRVCTRILLSPVGRRVDEFETLKELFGAIRDSHRALLNSSRKILHRDISIKNILLPPEPTNSEGGRGILIDFDCAVSLDPEDVSNARGTDYHCRTGTMLSMAIDVLDQYEGHSHNHKHDLESFFWVLYYLLILPTEEDSAYGQCAYRDLKIMFSACYRTAGALKTSIIYSQKPTPINPAYTVVLSFVEELRRAIRRDFTTRHLRDEEMEYQAKEWFTYDAFLDVLDRALVQLSLPGVDVVRRPSVKWSEFMPESNPDRAVAFASPPSNASVQPISYKKRAGDYRSQESTRPEKKRRCARG